MNRYVVIDLETTGHSPSTSDKIIEAGIVVIEDDQIIEEFATFLNPNKPIPSFISNLTGITDDDVKDAPDFSEKADEIIALFKDSYLIAHNVPFDLGFLNAELINHNRKPLKNPVIDTVELSRILFPKAHSYKLGQLAEYMEIQHVDPHRALSDAYVTALLFISLKQKLQSLPIETIDHLLRLEKNLKSDIHELLFARSEALAFSTEERQDITSYNGLAFKKIHVEQIEKPISKPSFGDFLDSIYELDGSMDNLMDHYEKRTGQRSMSEEIYDAFQGKKHALIEAETGTGKSLAYLIPAAYEAVIKKKRIVVSTYTTQLQSQLLDSEIPLVKRLIPFNFKTALLKGRQHYISLEKFEKELMDDTNDNYDIALTKAMILVWLTETDHGDFEEIQLPTKGYLFNKRISAETEGVYDQTSLWSTKSFYQKARKNAQQADIIITNHALLCTDMSNDYQFIPSYQKAIIDEAHHIEETVSKHYGLKLDYTNFQYTLNNIGATNDGNWLARTIGNHSIHIPEWDETFSLTKYEIDDLFRMLFQFVTEQNRHQKAVSDVGRIQYRFDSGKEELKDWQTIKEMATRLTFYLRDLIHLLTYTEQQLVQSEALDKSQQDEFVLTIQSLQSFIDRIEHLFLVDDLSQHVKWIEIEANGAKNAAYLYSEPIEVSSLLSNDLFKEKDSIVLTSATLTMKQSFSFIKKRLGIPEDRLLTNKIESPFSYQNQVQFLVPNDFPDVKGKNVDDFIYSTCEAILSLAEITKGRMLVLFTSYDMLKRSYYLLKETLDTQYMLIAQGISSGSRSRLKKNFINFDKAILLGTSSFWEGVDIPGEDLSCLIIVRLPFQPPNHPVYEAKASALKEQGKNAFFELSLPNAVIRFKQGFGRLIRSSNDRGIVFVCDARIMKARYSNYFTESIPNVPISFSSTPELMDKAKNWF
ncbi:ATP-dependent helicase DinG [Virgibacillus phasianinus]|uniref:3'-5' exonuclease DinG n=1 Tax=Virgibacillus phasianinus TaxID=2017483 RepID=A0A220U5I9_9BACI|nr:ATP-dependent DNA helicase DinG [Virgibacillus phasianinus]ASK63360.1 ATP-dependent helicase DinG [Virgibacillus phasianinus]